MLRRVEVGGLHALDERVPDGGAAEERADDGPLALSVERLLDGLGVTEHPGS